MSNKNDTMNVRRRTKIDDRVVKTNANVNAIKWPKAYRSPLAKIQGKGNFEILIYLICIRSYHSMISFNLQEDAEVVVRSIKSRPADDRDRNKKESSKGDRPKYPDKEERKLDEKVRRRENRNIRRQEERQHKREQRNMDGQLANTAKEATEKDVKVMKDKKWDEKKSTDGIDDKEKVIADHALAIRTRMNEKAKIAMIRLKVPKQKNLS